MRAKIRTHQRHGRLGENNRSCPLFILQQLHFSYPNNSINQHMHPQ